MQYFDPLYGQLEFGDKELKLFQTEALTRMRDISLSAVPPLATPSGIIASRFEHSVGVAHLARLLTQRKEFAEQTQNLFLASLLHDAGSPPFSHVSEPFLEEVIGKDHEEFAFKVFEEKDMVEAIKDYGGDTKLLLRLITGDFKPWSDLINGTIDLDNIDNSLRWGLGWGVFQGKFYEPEELIKAFIFAGGQLALDVNYQAQIQRWELCRRLVYDVVYSDMNLASGTMLFRALELAFKNNELDEEFFRLTESQALYVLEHRCNPRTRKLVHDMRHWCFYQPAVAITRAGSVSETMKALCHSWKERQKIADSVAEALGIPPEAVTVYAGKDKGFKQIHLPFVGGEKRFKHEPLQKLYWRIRVYLHPSFKDEEGAVREVVSSLLTE